MSKSVQSTQVHLGHQGRLVIPAELRHRMGLEPGDTLIAHIENSQLVLEKRETIEQRLMARFAHIPAGVSLADELIAERREEARREAEEM
jgi:AbrB family looped-hinge helix DNA binding protein